MVEKAIKCPQCESTKIVKKGIQYGNQRYKCKDCKKSFQLEYNYNAYKPEVREKIEIMAHNSSGVRDTARVLKINRNTVSNYFKKKRKQ